jgi:hypothetical protein
VLDSLFHFIPGPGLPLLLFLRRPEALDSADGFGAGGFGIELLDSIFLGRVGD